MFARQWRQHESRTGSKTQLYIHVAVVPSLPSDWQAPLPQRRLLDFVKVYIDPEETTTVSFTVTNRMLQLVDMDGTRKLVAGTYTLESPFCLVPTGMTRKSVTCTSSNNPPRGVCHSLYALQTRNVDSSRGS
jgi:hypothetical protein